VARGPGLVKTAAGIKRNGPGKRIPIRYFLRKCSKTTPVPRTTSLTYFLFLRHNG